MGLVFVPLQTLAFETLATHYRTTAASMLNLMRNIGGSIGVSVVTVLLAHNLQVSHSDLAAHVTTMNAPALPPSLAAPGQYIGTAALQFLENEINRQAMMIAYLDDFRLMMLMTIAALPLLLLIRRRRAPERTPA
jgi:DHA2 family multidrug resistance protein